MFTSRNYNSIQERQNLIPSISDLNNDSTLIESYDQDTQYATASQAFYDQSIFSFVVDEVHAMMQIMCCEFRAIANFYNPFYSIIFVLLFLLTFPGAVLHYIFLTCSPVKKREYPEERELRSQGMYTAMGMALLSIPFSIVSIIYGSDEMQLIDEVAIIVNISIIFSNLMALKAIADELLWSCRVFIVGVWIIDIILIILALFDAYKFLTLSWVSIISYLSRILEIFVYTTIGAQTVQFWNMYIEDSSSSSSSSLSALSSSSTTRHHNTFFHNQNDQEILGNHRRYIHEKDILADVSIAILQGLLIAVVLAGFGAAIGISEENTWHIMSW